MADRRVLGVSSGSLNNRFTYYRISSGWTEFNQIPDKIYKECMWLMAEKRITEKGDEQRGLITSQTTQNFIDMSLRFLYEKPAAFTLSTTGVSK